MRYFLCSLFLAAALTYAQESMPEAGTITAAKLTIRARPGMHYETLGTLLQGDEVEVISKRDEWYEIKLKGKHKGWIAADAVNEQGEVIAANSPIYCGPGVVFTALCQVKKGDKLVLVVSERKVVSWCQVEVPDGCTAWVSAKYVKMKSSAAAVAEAEEQQVVKAEQEAEAAEVQRRLNAARAAKATADAEAAKKAAEEAQQRMIQSEMQLVEKMRQADAMKLEEEKKKLEEQRLADEQKLNEEKIKVAAIEEQRKLAEEKLRQEEEKRAKAEELAKVHAQQAADVAKAAEDKVKEIAEKRLQLEEESKLAEAKVKEEEKRLARLLEQARIAQEKASQAEKTLKDAEIRQNELDAAVKAKEEAEKAAADAKAAEEKAAEDARIAVEKAAQEKAAKEQAEKEAALLAEKTARAKSDAEHGIVNYNGYIYSLGKNATPSASHILCFMKDGKAHPICFLHCSRFGLHHWYRRTVAIRGKLYKPDGWSLPLVEVTSVVAEKN